MKLCVPSRIEHSLHKGVQIYKETNEEGSPFFSFQDARSHWHKRFLKKGGTLTALKADIDWYLFNKWA